MRQRLAITSARTLLFGLLVLAATGCAKKSLARNNPPPPPSPRSASGSPASAAKANTPGAVPTISDLYGYASWYGYPYHGRKTASGEVYDMYQLTAAHKTLPLGTVVRVSNQDNGREVEVRINDRGPFVEGRIIDLSYAAAKQIQIVGPGIALVKLSVLETLNRMPPAQAPVVLASSTVSRTVMPAPRYGVQVGAFRQKENAQRLQEEILHRHTPVTIAQSDDLFKVLVGAEASEAAAQSLAASLRKEHFAGSVVLLP
jgi:rare lipoprotein A